MRFKYLPILLLTGSGIEAQDPNQSLNVPSSGLSPAGENRVESLTSCLIASPCQHAGRKIGIDDIVLSVDNTGNQKCCPRGTEFNGTSCVYPQSTVCPPNMHFRGGVCVLTSGPSCADKNLIPTKEGCVSKTLPQCPQGTTLKNGQCILAQDPTCPTGQTLHGGFCAIAEPPDCPAQGFYAKDNLCISAHPPTCQSDTLKAIGDRCVHVQRPGCPSGTRPDGNGRCISTEKPFCQSGFTVIGDQCVHPSTPFCAAGSTLQNDVCVSTTTPICTSGFLSNGICVDKQNPTCNRGFKLNDNSGFCEQRNQPFCPANFVSRYHKDKDLSVCCPSALDQFDGIFCFKTNPDSSPCPPNSQLVDDKCVSTPGTPPECDGGKGVMIKGNCYSRQPATCPFPLELQNGMCAYDNGPVCSVGTLSASGTECVVEGPNCPPGAFALGRQCISNVHTPECPAGLRPDGDQCVGTVTSDCPAGTILKENYCLHPNKKPNCEGSLTLFGDQCVLPITATCPDGTRPQGNQCVSLQNPICALPGYTYSAKEGACVYLTGPVCNSPYRLQNGKCYADVDHQCPTGTVLEGQRCISPANCVGDYTLEGDRCVHREKPKCQDPDTQLDEKTGQCISRIVTPVCEQGQMTANGQCVTQAICPSGLVPYNGYCVSLVPLRCGPGLRLQGDQCVLEKGPNCPPNHRPSGTECISVQEPKCPPNTLLDRDRCITASAPDCVIMGVCPEVA